MKKLFSILFIVVMTATTTLPVQAKDTRTCTKTSAQEIADLFDHCDLPGQIWSRVNVRLDRNQGGQSHAQETVYARRDYSTSANG
jgi:hypothetical protein